MDQGLLHRRVGGLDQVHLFLKDTLAENVFVVELVVHKSQVDVVGVQDAVQLRGLMGADVEIQHRPTVDELPIKRRQQGHVHAVGAADGEQRPLPPPLKQAGLLPQRHHPLRNGDEVGPLWGELDLFKSLAAENQRAVQFLFQQLEPVAHRRLGEKESIRCFGNALGTDNGEKHLDIGQIHTNASLAPGNESVKSY